MWRRSGQIEKRFGCAVRNRRQENPVSGILVLKSLLQVPVIDLADGCLAKRLGWIEPGDRKVKVSLIADDQSSAVDEHGQKEGNDIGEYYSQERVIPALEPAKLLNPFTED